jgi:hypothetical protein
MTKYSSASILSNAVAHYISTMKQSDIEEYLYNDLMAHYEKVADYEELHEFIKDYTPDSSSYNWFVSEIDKPNAGGAA